MTTHVLDIPDDLGERAAWLEDALLSQDLPSLVGELQAFFPEESARTLEDVLGPQLREVLARGFAGLDGKTLGALLSHPELLLELQERVLLECSEFWDEKLRASAVLNDASRRGWERLQPAAAPPSRAPSRLSGRRPERFWRAATALFAIAASVLLALVLIEPRSQPAVGWGWAKPAALPSNVAADVYLGSLADTADEWFRKRPTSRADLAQRVLQFRQGCSVLLLSEHRPLEPEDRAWLQERCRVWADKLDAELRKLESGGAVDEVQAAADEIVRNLAKALRQRAGEVS